MGKIQSRVYLLLLFCLLGIGLSLAQQRDSLLKELRSQENVDKVNTYILLSESFQAVDQEASDAYLDTASQLAEKYKYDYLIAKTSFLKGNILLNKGMINESLDEFKKAYLYLPTEGNMDFLSKILGKTGETYARTGRYDSALNIFYRNLEIQKELNDSSGIANTYLFIGNVNYYGGNLVKAIDNFRKSYRIFNNIDEFDGMATAAMNTGNAHEDLDNPDSALFYFLKSRNLFSESGIHKNLIRLLNNLGVYYYNQKKLDSALYYYEECIEATREMEDYYQMAVLYNNMALIENDMTRYPNAIKSFNKALELSKQYDYKGLLSNTLGNMSRTYAEMGKFEKAYALLTQHKILSDSLSNIEAKERIADLQIKYEKAKEIEKLENKSRINQLRYYYIIAILILVVLVAGIFLWIFIRINKQRKRNNLILQGKNQEISAQKARQEKILTELKENQRKTDVILNALPDVMFVFDREGNYLDYHTKKEENIIKSSEEIIGTNVKDQLPEEFSRKILEAINKAAEKHELQLFIHRDKVDGQLLDMEIRVAPVEDGTFLVIARNITERKNMERELKAARDEMQKALDAKSMYMASLSHEIRTPLTSIIGVTSILEETELSDEQQECTNIINISGNNLLNLINNILDFAKIESGQLKLEKVVLEISEVIEEVVFLLDVKAKDSNNKIITQIDPKLSKNIKGDPYRLTQILINLVNNAIKFTKNGEINIIAEVKEETSDQIIAKFEVNDTGIGVSTEQREKLFSAFSQADESIARKYGGTGLGLAISKHFVQMMQGEIGVDSEEGKGSKFWFSIKLDKQNPEKATRKTDKQNMDNNEKKEDPNQEQNGNINILLVEDNLLNQKFALAILKKQKHKVDIAENGKIGVELFDKNKYDIILMDIQMPVMDGIEATKEIRKIENEKGLDPIRIVAVTAYAMEGDEEKFYKAGIDDYLRKPYKAHQLIEKLEAKE